MVEEREWEVALEAAWSAVRRDVADVLADLESGACVLLEWGPELLDGYDDGDLESGAAPYVQATGYGEDRLRIEAVSNHYLDKQFELDADGVGALSDIGWFEPTYAPGHEEGEGSANFWFDLECRDADLGAVMLVQALRGAYGCLHPTLLATAGVYDPIEDVDAEAGGDLDDDEVPAVEDLRMSWPSNPSELQDAVLTAMSAIRAESVTQDPDGDVPIRVGQSMAFVRVMGRRPAVELFAELVIGLDHADPQLVSRELNILNRAHETATFYAVNGLVIVRQVLIATPFVHLQLKIAIEAFCGDLDEIARDLVERVGGHRFFDTTDEEIEGEIEDDAAAEDLPVRELPSRTATDPALDALIEMLRDGRLPTRSVVELFGSDRDLLVAALSRVRAGGVSCGPVGEERVLETLRRATRSVTRSDAERARAKRRPEIGRRLSVAEDEGGSGRRHA